MVLAHLRSLFWFFSHIKLFNMPKVILIKNPTLTLCLYLLKNNTQASNDVHIITSDLYRLSVNNDNIA